MLDEFCVKKPAGFPDHPHRGFETVIDFIFYCFFIVSSSNILVCFASSWFKRNISAFDYIRDINRLLTDSQGPI